MVGGAPEVAFERRHDRQNRVVAPVRSDHLDADGKTNAAALDLDAGPHRHVGTRLPLTLFAGAYPRRCHHAGGRAEHVVGERVRDSWEEMLACAVSERGQGERWADDRVEPIATELPEIVVAVAGAGLDDPPVRVRGAGLYASNDLGEGVLAASFEHAREDRSDRGGRCGSSDQSRHLRDRFLATQERLEVLGAAGGHRSEEDVGCLLWIGCGHRHHRCPHRLERGDGLLDGAANRRRHRVHPVVGVDADPQAVDRDSVRVGPRHWWHRIECQVQRRGREQLHRELQVAHRPGDRTGLGDHRLLAVAEQASGEVGVREAQRGRLEAVYPAEVGGDAGAAAKVAGQPERRTPGRDDRRLAATAATRRAVEVPRVVRSPVHWIVGLPAGEGLDDVRLAEHDRARSPERGDQRTFIVVDVPDSLAGPERGLGAGDAVLLLDGDRNAVQRADLVTARECRVGGCRLFAGLVEQPNHHRVQVLVDLLDAPNVSVDDLDRRHLAVPHLVRDAGCIEA